MPHKHRLNKSSLHTRTNPCRAVSDLLGCTIPSARRFIDTDLSVCRLVRKAGVALELLELPAIEFVDMFAVVVRVHSKFVHNREPYSDFDVLPVVVGC